MAMRRRSVTNVCLVQLRYIVCLRHLRDVKLFIIIIIIIIIILVSFSEQLYTVGFPRIYI